MPHTLGDKLKLGPDSKGKPVQMIPEMRSTHLHICGPTGTGKSKMLENRIRQDIAKWHESNVVVISFDPGNRSKQKDEGEEDER